MISAWPNGIGCGQWERRSENGQKEDFSESRFRKTFWPGTEKQAKCQVIEFVRHRDETETTARKPFGEEEFHK
jgi:hypothetical protein